MNIKEYFTELHRREAEAAKELEKIRAAIKAGQEVCKHDYQKIGNTHKDVYECRICGDRMTA